MVEAESIRLNTSLGMYTSFVNLLDLAAVAVPSGFRAQGLPRHITLTAPASHDDLLRNIALGSHRRSGLRSGAITHTWRRFPLAFSG
jgi:allophanate hydrolase